MSPDRQYLYVTNAGTQIAPDSSLSVIDLGGNQVTATVPLPARPQGAKWVAMGRF
ncbi:MAG: hypothetical protein IPP47_21500 [Bryobacterales bacterium]|nr:hypothetical protein [Bryobacterales bacterium]